jgi:acyl-coenzyme A synthetase/AMP-(fatty) acid ligase
MPNVADVVVSGERHAWTGQIVVATVRLAAPEPADAFKLRMRRFCAGRLSPFQIPSRVRFTDAGVHSVRFKRIRRTDAGSFLPPQA